MGILITNAKDIMVKRLLNDDMGEKVLWVAETSDGNIICLEDSTYILVSGERSDGVGYVNIISGDKYFTICNGEYDTVIME